MKNLKDEILKLVKWNIGAKKRFQYETDKHKKDKRLMAINNVKKTIETLYSSYCILYVRNEFNYNEFEQIGQYYFLKKY